MDIQQLQVKITAEMSGLRKALADFKAGFQGANKNAADTERAISRMGSNAAKSVNQATAAVKNMVAEINQAGNALRSMLQFNRTSYKEVGGIGKLNTREARRELQELEAKLAELDQKRDMVMQAMSQETNISALQALYAEYEKIVDATGETTAGIQRLKEQLTGFKDVDGIVNITKEIEQQQQKVNELANAWNEAREQLAHLAETQFGSDAMQQAEERVASLSQQFKVEGQVLQEMIDKANETPQAFKRISGSAAQAGSALKAVGKGASAAMKGLWNIYSAASRALKAMNPIPKVAAKLGSAFRSLWHKIKTAFIFSVVNSWFHNFRNQVASYLQTNSELQAALSGFKGAALTAFQPIYEAMIPALILLVNWLTAAISALARFFAMLGGKSVGTMRVNAQALNAQAKATKAAGGAAADAAKTIAAFDELNVLNGDKGGGGGGSDEEGAILFPDIEEGEEFATWGEAFSDLLDKLIAKIPAFDDVLQKIAEKMNKFSENVIEMFTFPGVQEKVSTLAAGIAESFNHFFDTINWENLGRAIGAGIQTAINFALTLDKTFDWKGLGDSIAESLNGVIEEIEWYDFGDLLAQKWNLVWQTFDGFVHTFDWGGLGDSISASFTGLLENLDLASTASALSGGLEGILTAIANFFETTDWKVVGETIVRKIKETIENIDWEDIIASLYEAAGAATGASVKLAEGLARKLIETFVEGWHEAQNYFAEEIEACGGSIIGGIYNGIDKAVMSVKIWILTHVYGPFIKGFMEAFGIQTEASGATAPAEKTVPMGESVMDGILKGIKQGWSNIGKWFSTTFQNIRSWISTTWDNIKKNTISKWTEIRNTVAEKVESVQTTIKTKFDNIRRTIETAHETIKTKITTKWEEIKNSVVQKVTDIKEEIKRKWEAIKSHISTICDELGIDIDGKWNKIKQSLIEIGETIRDKVSEAFSAMKDNVIKAFDGIGNGIKGPINQIIGFINSMISGVCTGINNMIYALNQVKFSLPDWVPFVGGSKFSLNIGYVGVPQIPLLAKGGVITDPTMAVMGEYAGAKSNPEIVAPQSLLKETMVDANSEMVSAMYQMAQQVIKAIEEMDMKVIIGDDTIAQAAKRGAEGYKSRTGKPMFA